jgi:hypothetical protein
VEDLVALVAPDLRHLRHGQDNLNTHVSHNLHACIMHGP